MLSACMMVKNEEKNLPRCLNSIKDIVDEIVIVDTGSTDNTIQIAKDFGAKIYHHPWQDNFSLHRNQSINYATNEWVLIIDADEEVILGPNVTKESIQRDLEELEDKYHACAVRIIDVQKEQQVMTCHSARIFRKTGIHYEGIVHNAPKFQPPAVLWKQFVMYHYGYWLSKEKMQEKFERTQALLMKQLEEMPNAYDTYFYLCQLYGQYGKPADSRYWGEKYLAVKDKMQGSFNPSIYFTMTKNYQEGGMMEEALRLIYSVLQENPIDVDMAFALSDQGALSNRIDLMVDGAKRFIKGYRHLSEHPVEMKGRFYFTFRDDLLTLSLYRLAIGSLQEGMEAWHFLAPRLKGTRSDLIEELRLNLSTLGLEHLLQQADFGDITLPPLPPVENVVLKEVQNGEINLKAA
jgi:glycosyltransferase involved in cell wall biosynthesis